MNELFMFVRMTIKDGETDNFRKTLAEVVRVANDGVDGPRGYEWFLSDGGRECTVVEIYDSPAAHAKHVQRVVLPHASKLREFSSSHISLAGNVPAEMLSQMRARLGDVPYLGPCISGLLASSTSVAKNPKRGVRACIAIQSQVSLNKADFVRDMAASTTRRLAAQSEIVAFEWFLDETTHNLMIIGLAGNPESLAKETSKTLEVLKQEHSTSKPRLDAPGIDIANAMAHFRGVTLGRLGGARIAGVL